MENVAGPWPLPQRGSTEGKRLPEPWPEMGIHFIQKAKILVVPCIFSFFYVKYTNGMAIFVAVCPWRIGRGGKDLFAQPAVLWNPIHAGVRGSFAAGGLRRGPRRVPPRHAPHGCFWPSRGWFWITIPNCAASRGGGRFTGRELAPPGQGEHHPAGGTTLWKMQNKTKWAPPQSSR